MNSGSSLKEVEPIFRAVLESGGVFTLQPRGSSMLPTIVPGRDSVSIVQPTEEILLHDILLYQRKDGSFVLHRVARIERDGSFTMCGDNQSVLERGILLQDVVGVVTAIHRPSGDLTRGSEAFLAPARRRARSRPLRYLRYCAGCWRKKLFGK